MKNLKPIAPLLILPLLIAGWGIFNLSFFDPFYSRSSDPEYLYLINGLNCAVFQFNRIGHIDNPGTPFQLFNGCVILITHIISGKGNIAQDVFARPEHYLRAVSGAMVSVQVLLAFLIGWVGARRKIPSWQIIILQAGCFFNNLLAGFFCRVNPDRFFMITGLMFILVYLAHGGEKRSMPKFAMWSGVVMALGFATKFNFLPLLFLPMLILDTNKNRMIYAGSGIASYFIFLLPVIDKFDEYLLFLSSIFHHDGLYGGGDANVLNFQKMLDNAAEIFKMNPELYSVIAVLIAGIIVAIRKRNEEGLKSYIRLFSGFLAIMALQMVMVSKHFKSYYLAPVFTMYGFMFFTVSMFLSRILKKKKQIILAGSLLPFLFFLFTTSNLMSDYPVIARQIRQREDIRNFVDKNISKDDVWFIEPTWESGPHAENAIVFGLSYCRHRDDYIPQLKAVNPNVITYEKNSKQVKLWRGIPVSLDSVVASGRNMYIYSTPGRNAPVLLEMVNDAAVRNNQQLSKETVFFCRETRRAIVKVKAIGTAAGQQPSGFQDTTSSRQQKIDVYIQLITNTPDWLAKVKKKAAQKNIPLDSMILLDAIWMVDNE